MIQVRFFVPTCGLQLSLVRVPGDLMPPSASMATKHICGAQTYMCAHTQLVHTHGLCTHMACAHTHSLCTHTLVYTHACAHTWLVHTHGLCTHTLVHAHGLCTCMLARAPTHIHCSALPLWLCSACPQQRLQVECSENFTGFLCVAKWDLARVVLF